MYIRFVCAAAHPHADAELGVYMGQSLVAVSDQPDWLQQLLDAALDEVRRLAVPDSLGDGGTADGRRALCWLRAENAQVVARFRFYAWVLDEMGLRTAAITTRDPGRIIYRDNLQVVAIPAGRVRRAFPRRPRPGLS